MKVLICGSRDWINPDPIKYTVDSLTSGSTILVGGCRGVDLIAQNLAEKRDDIEVKVFYAKWDLYGKSAGPMRNLEMLNEKPDIVYAFPLGKSKGTSYTIAEAKKRGILTIVYGRQYTFWPADKTIWNTQCMDDTIIYIKKLMDERRK